MVILHSYEAYQVAFILDTIHFRTNFIILILDGVCLYECFFEVFGVLNLSVSCNSLNNL